MKSLNANLAKWGPVFLSILRIVVALVFIQHGMQKFFGFPAPAPASLPALAFAQGLLESVGGMILLLGAYTRLIAFILSGDMAVAYFMVHAPNSMYPLVNKGDLAVVLCFVFLYLFFAGGGAWSLDRSVLKQE